LAENKNGDGGKIIIGSIIIAFAIILTIPLTRFAVIDPEQLANITQSMNITAPIDDEGNVEVVLQDQVTRPFDFFFMQSQHQTTLSENHQIGAHYINLTNASGCDVGDYLAIFQPNGTRYFFADVLAISTNEVQVDTPLDFEFLSGHTVLCTIKEMAVDGSDTQQIFEVRGPSQYSNFSIDITRIMITLVTTDAPEFTEFGDIAGGITNGIVLRKRNDIYWTIWNVKDNGEFANLAYDFYTLASRLPSGTNGIAIRYTFAGQDKHGVALRLLPGESLELIVQDDLTDLVSFKIVAEGHIVN